MNKLAIILIAALVTPALFAQDVGELLDRAANVEKNDAANWVDIRTQIVALGENALPELKAAAAKDNWTEEDWVRAMAADVCRVRIEKPEVAARIDAPECINPERYKLNRDGKPHCNRDLRDLGEDAVPLLLERLRWTFDAHTYSEGAAGELERNAFADGLLHVPGYHGDTRARFAPPDALLDKSLPNEWRQTAAVSFAQTADVDAIATLNKVFDDEAQAIEVREACGWAFGRVMNRKAADALKQRLEDEAVTGNQNLRRGLITGVGILGSSWTWKSRGPMMEAAGDEVRESCARMMIKALKQWPEEQEIISRSLSLTAYEDSAQWLHDLAADKEATAATRQAAKQCIEPLETAIKRNK